jgi:CheY-like chemotaxis protein
VRAATQGTLILVVEDEAAVRAVSVGALTELGYKTLEADGAAAALDMLHQHSDIAMLLTDVVMPETDGVVLAAKARLMRPELPILFMTGFTGDAVEAEGALTREAVLRKPFTIEALARAVHETIEGGARRLDAS